MELFDKIYNCYFQVVSCILDEASIQPATKAGIQSVFDEMGFLESGFTMIPKLTDGTWNFLDQTGNDLFVAKLDTLEDVPLTNLQRSWMKALLEDVRFQLFFTADEFSRLQAALKGIPPLYHPVAFYHTEQFADGDDFLDPDYKMHFQRLTEAIKLGHILHLQYHSPRERIVELDFFPCNIHYSAPDNKLRLLGAQYIEGKAKRLVTLNLSRILTICEASYRPEHVFSITKALQQKLPPEPVTFEILAGRNALERSMLQFSCYAKHTVYDKKKKKYICSIFYEPEQEAVLLEDLLSYGSMIKVLGPESFLKAMKKRLRKKYKGHWGSA